MRPRRLAPLVIFIITIGFVVSAIGAGQESSSFGTYEGAAPKYSGMSTQSLYVTMRDGVKIAVDVVLPKNLPEDAKIPAVMKMTCYWRAVDYRPPLSWFRRSGEFERVFTGHGYALVLVDVRGTGASFGARPYPLSREEVLDGSDLADWIIAQPWSNGKVGSIGTSYSGTTAELLAVNNHPAVKAVIPRFADHDLYFDIAYPGGILFDWMMKNWGHYTHLLDNNIVPSEAGLMGRLFVRGVKPVNGDTARRLLRQAVAEHADNGDVYELVTSATFRDDANALSGVTLDDLSTHTFRKDIERSNVGVFSWGGWMDETMADAAIRRFMTYSNPQRTVIGPWSHGGEHHASPYLSTDTPTDPSMERQWLECVKFFDYFLKDIDNGVMDEKVLFYYTMGEERWKTTTVWPPKGSVTQRWYLSAGNTLSSEPPSERSGADRYTVDFEATTGATNRWHTQMGGDVSYPDRAEQDRRLLTYTSEPLAEDTEITGHPVVTLYVASTHTDGAFFVYLEDVDENGRVTYVTEGQLRALHRKVSTDEPPYAMLVPYHSFKREDGAPLVPGETAELTFGMHPTSVLIRKGHRIRIAIAGHDKDTFARIPAEGNPVITIERNARFSSHIDLPIIQR
ncbi:MAG: CocE/NonD family hydrolase [Candidatus Abyssubacteria bacterium]